MPRVLVAHYSLSTILAIAPGVSSILSSLLVCLSLTPVLRLCDLVTYCIVQRLRLSITRELNQLDHDSHARHFIALLWL